MKFDGSVVPIIDLTPARTGDEAAKEAVAEQVGAAARSIGFLVVSGHGVPMDVIENVSDESRKIFDLSPDGKARYRSPDPAIYRGYFGIETGNLASTIGEEEAKPDHREYYNIGRFDIDETDPYFTSETAKRIFHPNIWPDADVPGFKPALVAYYHEMEKLAELLMELCARALKLPPDWFADKIDKHITNMVISNYPDQPEELEAGQLRAGAHTDYGGLTILKTEDKPGGLQVQTSDGRWEPVPIVPGAFIINLGDLMAQWTNDEWVSTMHRVINPPRDQGIGSRRQSLVFFHQPNYDAVIECIPTCTETAPKYARTTSIDHLEMKMNQMNDTPKFKENEAA
ncbi:isopenicillin N synthase family oxygenase [Sphingobium terrigena]|uniref:Isopenicillin N synthase family oxygenase n=1 Tax=Sphingobium terrigena TaxID=2304063 RepID=A0A418YMR7_9SPHN|nr:2-oxoglutarate and iron-dependent oxygenase domain-containing protein [Sphingobium terrigena]PZU56276.1 MAG: 2OG-Fe(II) oxygenase [Sphingobium sp.]RJG52425.1 isopenicillin N synthase family oxygenase [Sphingobium terrigena]